MVRHYFPQAATGSVGVNTNYPPQSGSENVSSPVGGTMEYQDFVGMEYEDLDDMDYESSAVAVIPEDWFDISFKSRISLTINSSQVISGPQTDFQMLINSTFSEMVGKVQSLGQDIRFAGVDKVQLPYEIENFIAGTGNLSAWIKKTIDNNEIIYMYFNKLSANDAQTPSTVWDVNNLAVWHMNQTSFGANSTIDSTGNVENNFTPTNMDSSNQVSGKIDGTLRFNDGVTNEQSSGTSTSLNALRNNFTVMAWIKPNSIPFNVVKAIIGRLDQWHWGYSNIDEMFILFPSIGFHPQSTSVGSIVVGKDVHLTITINNATPNNLITYYTDGALQGTSPVADPGANVGSGEWNIADRDTSGAELLADMSEQRIYSGVLDSTKITTIFNNENDPDSPTGFYSIGSIENI